MPGIHQYTKSRKWDFSLMMIRSEQVQGEMPQGQLVGGPDTTPQSLKRHKVPLIEGSQPIVVLQGHMRCAAER